MRFERAKRWAQERSRNSLELGQKGRPRFERPKHKAEILKKIQEWSEAMRKTAS